MQRGYHIGRSCGRLCKLPNRAHRTITNTIQLQRYTRLCIQKHNFQSRIFSSVPSKDYEKQFQASNTASPEFHADMTHFGYQTVARDAKASMVEQVFRRVADKYDLMNDAMSGGMHRLWKDEFVRMLGPVVSESNPTKVLDVAGGTGDIAFRIAENMRSSIVRPAPNVPVPEIVICDINDSMLEVGMQRSEATSRSDSNGNVYPKLSWVKGDAQCLPFQDNEFDVYTIAFGIRNVTDVQVALNDAYRILKPGGRFMCLEFSHVIVPGLAQIYDQYSFNVIPLLGEMIANDRGSYQYLVESIRRFPTQENFADMIRKAGFRYVHFTNFTAGVCAVHSGIKIE